VKSARVVCRCFYRPVRRCARARRRQLSTCLRASRQLAVPN